MKFKVGDRVRVIGGQHPRVEDGHLFELGSIVYVQYINSESMWPYTCYYLDDSDYWCCREEDLELVEGEEPFPTKPEAVNNPAHYGTGKIECIEYIKDFLTPEEFIGYLRGNIAKYLHRWRYKNGLEDLKKAEWYLKYLIEFMQETK